MHLLEQATLTARDQASIGQAVISRISIGRQVDAVLHQVRSVDHDLASIEAVSYDRFDVFGSGEMVEFHFEVIAFFGGECPVVPQRTCLREKAPHFMRRGFITFRGR